MIRLPAVPRPREETTLTDHSVRPAAVAGLFYPGNAATLRAQIAGLLGAASTPARELAPKILLAPHAGYVYSGAVAAAAYATLGAARERIRRVVLLGPAHRVALRGLAAPTVDAFETPLGRVPIDAARREAALAMPHVRVDDLAHRPEHCLEVQLPFLQVLFPDFTIVPLLVGDTDAGEVAAVLERLWGGPDTRIV
ncbi:AmmeMemoRadiSam system protein B, partial [Piscinibacter sp.]|uniref:AmmeMemoRadiSam system protein B n=1 Tax=Piscinibacter sp. TaxID=1903157 RepID=UPI0037848726